MKFLHHCFAALLVTAAIAPLSNADIVFSEDFDGFADGTAIGTGGGLTVDADGGFGDTGGAILGNGRFEGSSINVPVNPGDSVTLSIDAQITRPNPQSSATTGFNNSTFNLQFRGVSNVLSHSFILREADDSVFGQSVFTPGVFQLQGFTQTTTLGLPIGDGVTSDFFTLNATITNTGTSAGDRTSFDFSGEVINLATGATVQELNFGNIVGSDLSGVFGSEAGFIPAINTANLGGHTVVVDNFTVSAITAAVPEPSSICMLAALATGLVVRRRKR